MKYDKELDNYIQEIKKYKRYSEKENIEYLKRYTNGEKYLIDDIFKMNALLVVKCACKFSNIVESINLDMMDLVQYGNLELIRAIETYDFSYDTTFSTWACFLIQRKINFIIIRHGYSFKYNQELCKKIYKYNEIYNILSQKLNREPNIHELALALNVTEEKILEIEMFKATKNTISLNSSNKDEETELIETIEDKENLLNIDNMNEYILNFLKKVNLTDKEYQVILLRYGLLDSNKKTQVEIAEELNVSKQRIWALEKSALEKIKKSKYIFELASYTDYPTKNLENIGYDKTMIKTKLDNINKI